MEFITEDQVYREKKRAHHRKIYLRAGAAAAAVILVLFVYILYQNNRVYSGARLTELSGYLQDDDASLVNLQGTIVQYGRHRVQCVNTRGETVWEQQYDMQQPIVSMAGDVLAIADYEGNQIYVVNRDGVMGSFTTEQMIQSISAAENGEVAVIMNDNGTSWIRLYTARGREIAYFVRTMTEHGYPISAAVSPRGDLVCLSSLQVEESSIKTYVSFYSFGAAGANAVDHLVSGYDYANEVFPFVHFLKDGTCIGVSDSRLAYYEGKDAPRNGMNSMISETIRGVYYSDRYVGLLFTDTSGANQYRLDLYDDDGDKKSSVGFSMDFTTLQIYGDYIYLNNDQELQVYTLGGRKVFGGSLGTTIRIVIPSMRPRRLTVVTDSEVDAVELR